MCARVCGDTHLNVSETVLYLPVDGVLSLRWAVSWVVIQSDACRHGWVSGLRRGDGLREAHGRGKSLVGT